MGIFRRILMILLVWCGLFYFAYTLIPSRSEEMLLQVNRAIENAKGWNTIKTEQTLWGNGKEEMRVDTLSSQETFVNWAKSESKLTEEQNFEFEVYFQQDMIYAVSNNDWTKFDYTHPISGELEGLKDPLAFWQRNLKYVNRIEKKEDTPSFSLYSLELMPFRDQIHGILFEDLEQAVINVWVEKKPFGVQKMVLHSRFKPSLNRLYDNIDYEIKLNEVQQPYDKPLPADAQRARKLD